MWAGPKSDRSSITYARLRAGNDLSSSSELVARFFQLRGKLPYRRRSGVPANAGSAGSAGRRSLAERLSGAVCIMRSGVVEAGPDIGYLKIPIELFAGVVHRPDDICFPLFLQLGDPVFLQQFGALALVIGRALR